MMEDTATDSAEIYTPGYYDRIRALEHRHWWHLGTQRVALSLLASLREPVFRRVLDAGCGTGGMMAWAERELGATALFGIDVAVEAVRACAARNPRWSIRLGSVTELPYEDSMFDLVVCNDVIQHLPTNGGDLIALKEFKRVLAPAGLLILRTNSRQGMRQDPADQDHDYRRYVRAEVVDLMEQAGLTVRRETYVNVLGGAHESLRRVLTQGQGRRHHHEHEDAPLGSDKIGAQRHVYEGLRMRDTAREKPVLNRVLLRLFDLEARYLRVNGRSLPFGHSIAAVGEKPKS